MKITATSAPRRGAGGLVASASRVSPQVSLPTEALDDRIAIVGTAGSGKTYAAKGFVERLLETGARVAIVDPRTPIGDPYRHAQLEQELGCGEGRVSRSSRRTTASLNSGLQKSRHSPRVPFVPPASTRWSRPSRGPRDRGQES